MKFCTRVRLKPSNDRGDCELDRARSKNNIAENSFTLGHETDNIFSIYQHLKYHKLDFSRKYAMSDLAVISS